MLKFVLRVHTIKNIELIYIFNLEYLPTKSVMERYQVMKDKFSVTLVNVVNDICRNNSLEDIKQMLVSREANMLIEVEAVKDKVTLTALLRTYCFSQTLNFYGFCQIP